MIKFFRRIRQKLLRENQFSKYLLYAIGEIILVVIGILIALQINNWNEERIASDYNRVLLKQVHKELAFNIKKANDVIEFYRYRNPLIATILDKNVTYNDYKSSRKYGTVLFGSQEANLANDDYINFMDNQNHLNQGQDPIILKLKELYRTNKNEVDNFDEVTLKKLVDFTERRKHNPWFHNYAVLFETTDEMILYLLNDTYYLNEVVLYQLRNLGSHFGSTLRFRNKAVAIYSELSDHLGIKKDTAIVKNVKDYTHYQGTYVREGSENKFVINERNNQLFFTITNKAEDRVLSEYNFYPDTKTFFTGPSNVFGTLLYNDENKVIGLTRTLGTKARYEYKKIK